MKHHFHTYIIGLIFFGLIFTLSACQRNTGNVQAAREPNANASSTEPGATDSNATEPRDTEASASDTSSGGNVITGADREFVMQAVKDHVQERVLGHMAQQHSQNDGIINYGKMIVKDHNEALTKLVDLMNKNGIPQPKQLPEERSEAIKKMEGLSGAALDKQFLAMMVQIHQKAIEMYKREADSGQNSDIRDYAKNVLPMLEKHLEDAENLEGRMNIR